MAVLAKIFLRSYPEQGFCWTNPKSAYARLEILAIIRIVLLLNVLFDDKIVGVFVKLETPKTSGRPQHGSTIQSTYQSHSRWSAGPLGSSRANSFGYE